MPDTKTKEKGQHVPLNSIEIEIPGQASFNVPHTGGKFAIVHRTRRGGSRRYTAEVSPNGLRVIKEA